MLDGLTFRLTAAFVLAAAVFLLWPGIDLWVAHRFSDGSRFPLRGSEALEDARNLIWGASIVTALGSLVLWLIWLPLGSAASVPPRLWGWIVAIYVVGPGILVNAILKEHWGRARPARVFREKGEFTPPFVIADECNSNCSFVSGEASAAAALAIVVGALLWRRLAPRRRRVVLVVLGTVAAVGGMLRVMTGRHFLSDVIFAWFFVAFIALGLWHLMRIAPARDALTIPALRADLREIAGRWGRRWRRLVG